MKQMLLLFSHHLSVEQKNDALISHGIESFLPMPEDIQQLWSNIPPDIQDISGYLEPIMEFVAIQSSRGDAILIQGDFGATYTMVNFCKSLGLLPLYATTRRNVVESTVDGKTVKTSVFEHILFREYRGE